MNEENGGWVIVRTYSAGCFAGQLVAREGKECTLHNARRLWYWSGAASLSELAQRGSSKPKDCKFPMAVDEITLMETIEVISMSAGAVKKMNEVPVWTA